MKKLVSLMFAVAILSSCTDYNNGELVGGAKYTKLNKDIGEWLFYGFIKNLHKRQALSLEKKIQIRSRKLSGTPIERRLKAFNSILPINVLIGFFV